MKYTVEISGKAWRSLPLGADPAHIPDSAELSRIRSFAKSRPCGRGECVTLTGTKQDLAHYARALDSMAYVDLNCCDTQSAKREGRECERAAKRIWQAIGVDSAAPTSEE